AVAVKVGHAYGERNGPLVRMFSQVSLGLSIALALIMGTAFYIFPNAILNFYTVDPAVVKWGKTLLFWVACFQLFDGLQVTLSGILRGLSVTSPSSISVF